MSRRDGRASLYGASHFKRTTEITNCVQSDGLFCLLPLYSSSKNALVGSGEVSVLDEAGCIRLREESGYLAEQGLALDVAVGAEACANAVEVGIAVSGVAAKFIGSCSGKGREDLCERGGVQLPSG